VFDLSSIVISDKWDLWWCNNCFSLWGHQLC